MPTARKPWSKQIDAHGVTVRLYERAASIYSDVRGADGARVRQSLRTRDRAHALQLAEDTAASSAPSSTPAASGR